MVIWYDRHCRHDRVINFQTTWSDCHHFFVMVIDRHYQTIAMDQVWSPVINVLVIIFMIDIVWLIIIVVVIMVIIIVHHHYSLASSCPFGVTSLPTLLIWFAQVYSWPRSSISSPTPLGLCPWPRAFTCARSLALTCAWCTSTYKHAAYVYNRIYIWDTPYAKSKPFLFNIDRVLDRFEI